MHSVCDPELPDAGEVWDGVVEDVDQWWGRLVVGCVLDREKLAAAGMNVWRL